VEIGNVVLICCCDLYLDPMTFTYEVDPCPMKISHADKNELSVSRLLQLALSALFFGAKSGTFLQVNHLPVKSGKGKEFKRQSSSCLGIMVMLWKGVSLKKLVVDGMVISFLDDYMWVLN